MRTAVVDNEGVVVNVVLLDEDSDWNPGDNLTLESISDDETVSPGHRRTETGWLAPDPIVKPDPEPSMAERLEALEVEVRGMKDRVSAASVTNADAVKVRDAISGPQNA